MRYLTLTSIFLGAMLWLNLGLTSPALAQGKTPAKPAEQTQTEKQQPAETAEDEALPTQDNANNTLEYQRIFDTLPKSQFDNYRPLNLITKVLEVLALIVAGLALIGLIYSGIMFITAGSDDEKAKKAKQNVIWTLSGVLIYILGYLVIYRILEWVASGS